MNKNKLLALADQCDVFIEHGTYAVFDQDNAKQIASALRLASRQEVSVTVETQRLADAMWQLLDDMGTEGKTVCLAAKAGARVAYEPFRDKSEPEYDDWMPLADAERILKECGQ